MIWFSILQKHLRDGWSPGLPKAWTQLPRMHCIYSVVIAIPHHSLRSCFLSRTQLHILHSLLRAEPRFPYCSGWWSWIQVSFSLHPSPPHLCVCVCACMPVCLSVSVYVHEYGCMWKSEKHSVVILQVETTFLNFYWKQFFSHTVYSEYFFFPSSPLRFSPTPFPSPSNSMPSFSLLIRPNRQKKKNKSKWSN